MLTVFRNLAIAVVPPSMLGRLRSWRTHRHINGFPAYSVTHTYGGHRFSIRIADDLAKGWYDRDWEKLSEFEFLISRGLLKNSRVFDLGAHQGVVALLLAREASEVVAVEANQHNAEMCRLNVASNGAHNVSVLHAAISDKAGRLTFNAGLNGQVDDGSRALGQCEVEAVTIDALSEKFGYPDVLVIDVEGFECQALRGATKTLERRPYCVIEVHVDCGLEKFGSLRELAGYFAQGYDLFGIHGENDRAEPISTDGIQAARARFHLIALPKASA